MLSFPVSLISASVRIGKSCIDNLLVKAARGEFVVWCDSDDVLMPEALQTLLQAWEELSNEQQNDYMGVSARDIADGLPLGLQLPPEADGWSWNKIYAGLQADLTILARADLMRDHPFLEVDYLIPETSVWNIIGQHKSRFIDKTLKTRNYKQPFALSFVNKMQYNRGRAHALARNYPYVKDCLSVGGEFFRGINYIRYCAHGEIGVRAALKMWVGGAISHATLLLGLFPACCLIVRDRLKGVVEKTHVSFEQARSVVQIKFTDLSSRVKV